MQLSADEINHRVADGVVPECDAQGDDSSEQAVQLDVQVTAAHDVQGLVAQYHGEVRVLKRKVHAQDRIVRRVT